MGGTYSSSLKDLISEPGGKSKGEGGPRDSDQTDDGRRGEKLGPDWGNSNLC